MDPIWRTPICRARTTAERRQDYQPAPRARNWTRICTSFWSTAACWWRHSTTWCSYHTPSRTGWSTATLTT